MLRDEFTRHLTATINTATPQTEPFDYVQLAAPFPPDLYARMIAELPETRFYGELQHSDARLPDGHSARRKLELRPAHLRRLPVRQRDLWLALAEALRAPEVEAGSWRRGARRLGVPVGDADGATDIDA